ncbi:MAG: DUF655 domain-containing protein [Methanosarcinaceae archaeon]|nr:DUF655 domain-containing protein [Methanosarcinaceae archaeon]
MENRRTEKQRRNSTNFGKHPRKRYDNKSGTREAPPQKPATVHILDYLPHGYENDNRPIHARQPIIQAIDENLLTLLEITPKEDEAPPSIGTIITTGGKDGLRIKRRITYDELSRGAKLELPISIQNIIDTDTARFMTIFNQPQAISPRLNTLNLIPGIGEKLMWEIIDAVKEKPFENFEEIEERIPTLYSTKQKVADRIIQEIKGEEKYYLIATPPKQRYERKTR